jgi:hypothetical protein
MQDAPQPLTKEDQELKDLSVKCSKLAVELQDELCKVSSHKRRREAVGQAVKILIHKGTIEELQRRLSECQDVLNTRLLARLRYAIYYQSALSQKRKG